jgi:hypothetical protein
MNRFFYLFLFAILISCSKEKRIERNLDGNWLATKVRVEDGEGFLYDDSIPDGELLFDVENKAVSGKVNFDYLLNSGSVCQDSLTMNSFNYNLDPKQGYFYAQKNGLGYDFRILLLTPTDLQIEYYDLQKYQLKRFVFIKK